MNGIIKRVLGYSLAVTSLIFAAGQAHAGLVVTVAFNGGAGTSVQDNMLGDNNPLVGKVSAVFIDGTSSVTINATSKAPDGFLTDTQLDADIEGMTYGTVVVSDDGYLTGTSPSLFTSGVAAVQVDAGLVVDVLTDINGTTVLNLAAIGVGYQLDSASIPTNTTPNSFTITHTTNFNNTTTGARTASFTTATNIPEPSVVALLGMGLVGFGFARRRNRSV